MKLEGLYTAMITPFDIKGNLNEDGLRQNLRYQLEHQVQGIVVLGSTGETPTLNPHEKQTIIKIAHEEVKGKAVLMVGTGSYSTENTISATRQAYEMGADAALIVTPYYNRPTQEGLYRHFKAICESTPIPICIYNVQGRTGQNLQTETLKRLTDFPSVIGVKEASGNMMQINEVLEEIGNAKQHFSIVSGDDAFTLPLMALGGHGIISVASNLIPGPVNHLVQAATSGDYNLARKWHYQLMPLFKAAFIETNPIPIKAAMQFFGMPSGECRLPLCELRHDSLNKLKQVLKTIPPSWFEK